jgi:hypothetical protein
MTVRELRELLNRFPPDLPVFFAPDESERRVVAPQTVIMNLVHPQRREVIAEDSGSSLPKGFVDALVIYSGEIRA